jgi:ribonuclease HII
MKKEVVLLDRFYDDANTYELSIDEAGRGCLFGRVYVGCVVLPKEPSLFDGTNIKDSKKFTSKQKLNDTAEYIKENALAWCVEYIEADVIDNINILKSVMQGMHNCIRKTMAKLKLENENISDDDLTAVIDGNYFTPYMVYNDDTQSLIELKAVTVEKGDAKFMGIAAASILAKSSRDAYVEQLCDTYPQLDEYYSFKTNMGYGTKLHREGIQTHGITQWHRRSFGAACRNAEMITITAPDST